MFRKVSAEAKPTSLVEVQSCLDEVTTVKNSNARHGGFSASQWVLGQCPRGAPSFADEQTWCDLGALEARHDPTSIFAMQNLARIEAQKAFVHIDTSKRVQRAPLRNAQPYAMEYQVGDVVCFRRDNNNPYGKTTWSTACRIIGFEGDKSCRVLSQGIPVLVSVHALRPTQDAEALALSILKGEPLVPEGVVTNTQQAYVDLRGQEPHTGLDHPDGRGSSSAGPILRSVPEEAEDDEGEESDTIGEIDFRNLETPLYSPRASVSREAPQEVNTRNVRPRLGTELEPEGERTPSLSGSNAGYPPGLPAAADSIGESSEPLRRHFTEARVRTESPSELPEEGNYATRSAFVAFMGRRQSERR